MLKTKKKRRGRFIRYLMLVGAGVTLYAIAVRQRPGPIMPVKDGGERVVVRDRGRLSGLGAAIADIFAVILEDPRNVELASRMSITVVIEPVGGEDIPLTLTFSDGYVVIESGVAERPDLHLIARHGEIVRTLELLTGWPTGGLPYGKEALELSRRFLHGEVRLNGWSRHLLSLFRLRRLFTGRKTDSQYL